MWPFKKVAKKIQAGVALPTATLIDTWQWMKPMIEALIIEGGGETQELWYRMLAGEEIAKQVPTMIKEGLDGIGIGEVRKAESFERGDMLVRAGVIPDTATFEDLERYAATGVLAGEAIKEVCKISGKSIKPYELSDEMLSVIDQADPKTTQVVVDGALTTECAYKQQIEVVREQMRQQNCTLSDTNCGAELCTYHQLGEMRKELMKSGEARSILLESLEDRNAELATFKAAQGASE